MEFALTKDTPVSKWWQPKLMFTGVSIMGINPDTRKFNRSFHTPAATQELPCSYWQKCWDFCYFGSFRGFSLADMHLHLSMLCAQMRISEMSCLRMHS